MTSDYREMDKHIRLRDGFFNPDMLHDPDMIDEVPIFPNSFDIGPLSSG